MPRRVKRSSPKPPSRLPKDTGTTGMRLRGRPPAHTQQSNPIPESLESRIVKNWKPRSSNINTCVPTELWPYAESDPKKWPIDILHLLHEASAIDLRKKGAIQCSNNEHFRASISHEIDLRQVRNRSASGKRPWMTATDLKKVIKDMHAMAKVVEDAREKGQETAPEEESGKNDSEKEKSSVRRGRSRANNAKAAQKDSDQVNGAKLAQQEKSKSATRGRERPKRIEPSRREEVKPATKRQASDLPIRPARKARGGKSPKNKPAAPPVTPANQPEDSDEEEEEDQENEPPEPVSGRHIYGDFIKPTTIDFVAGADSEAAAQAQPRQTRKRGRADDEKPPTEEQIDSDPRDIDATGFLSELDPKEARRRRRPRLSRLQHDVVLEPAWSQDVPAPLSTPATDGPISGTPAAPAQASTAIPSATPPSANETTTLAMKMLWDLLPRIPAHATPDERRMLEDRLALIQRDLNAYKTAVLHICERA